MRDLQFVDAISGNDATYDTDWAIGNFGGGSITLSRLADAGFGVTGAGCRMAFELGVSEAGQSPRIETSFTAQDTLYLSIPVTLSALYADWPSNKLKLWTINQGVGGKNIILSLLRDTYGGDVALGHYLDIFAAEISSNYLNNHNEAARGAGFGTSLEAGKKYEIEILVQQSTGTIKWWQRNETDALAPVQIGNHTGLALTVDYTDYQLITQMGGAATSPTTFNADYGRIRAEGIAA